MKEAIQQKGYLRLGVNVDHVATVRKARGIAHPDPVRAAALAAKAGADGITAHLREDRRHIVDDDITHLSTEINLPLNLEMAATEEMRVIALQHKPHAACIVPEKREELTTEGGLDAVRGYNNLMPFVRDLLAVDIRVSLFIDPEIEQLDAALSLGVPVVELHTGTFCEVEGEAKREGELERLRVAADHAEKIGLECHAGHGLSFETVKPIAAITTIAELNIGHFLIGEAIFSGLGYAIERMRKLMNEARAEPRE